jgi:hypothetical protein
MNRNISIDGGESRLPFEFGIPAASKSERSKRMQIAHRRRIASDASDRSAAIEDAKEKEEKKAREKRILESYAEYMAEKTKVETQMGGKGALESERTAFSLALNDAMALKSMASRVATRSKIGISRGTSSSSSSRGEHKCRPSKCNPMQFSATLVSGTNAGTGRSPSSSSSKKATFYVCDSSVLHYCEGSGIKDEWLDGTNVETSPCDIVCSQSGELCCSISGSSYGFKRALPFLPNLKSDGSHSVEWDHRDRDDECEGEISTRGAGCNAPKKPSIRPMNKFAFFPAPPATAGNGDEKKNDGDESIANVEPRKNAYFCANSSVMLKKRVSALGPGSFRCKRSYSSAFGSSGSKHDYAGGGQGTGKTKRQKASGGPQKLMHEKLNDKIGKKAHKLIEEQLREGVKGWKVAERLRGSVDPVILSGIDVSSKKRNACATTENDEIQLEGTNESDGRKRRKKMHRSLSSESSSSSSSASAFLSSSPFPLLSLDSSTTTTTKSDRKSEERNSRDVVRRDPVRDEEDRIKAAWGFGPGFSDCLRSGHAGSGKSSEDAFGGTPCTGPVRAADLCPPLGPSATSEDKELALEAVVLLINLFYSDKRTEIYNRSTRGPRDRGQRASKTLWANAIKMHRRYKGPASTRGRGTGKGRTTGARKNAADNSRSNVPGSGATGYVGFNTIAGFAKYVDVVARNTKIKKTPRLPVDVNFVHFFVMHALLQWKIVSASDAPERPGFEKIVEEKRRTAERSRRRETNVDESKEEKDDSRCAEFDNEDEYHSLDEDFAKVVEKQSKKRRSSSAGGEGGGRQNQAFGRAKSSVNGSESGWYDENEAPATKKRTPRRTKASGTSENAPLGSRGVTTTGGMSFLGLCFALLYIMRVDSRYVGEREVVPYCHYVAVNVPQIKDLEQFHPNYQCKLITRGTENLKASYKRMFVQKTLPKKLLDDLERLFTKHYPRTRPQVA